MDFRNVPTGSEVNSWSPDALTEYFRTLNFKDCEKFVRKNGISGKRFLEMSENDIQKFPKLRVPILIKIQQEINKKEEKRGFFPKRAATQKVNQEAEYIPAPEEENEWSDSSFEEDDYESPNDDCVDEADYESPTDTAENESDDYEPPPSNDVETHPGILFPSKSSSGNSEYIDRPPTGSSTNPPEPPQRPGHSTLPTSFSSRGLTHPALSPPTNQEEKFVPARPFAPNIDRRTKPRLEHSCPPNHEKSIPVPGKKPSFPVKAATLPRRPQIAEKTPDLLKKPPVPSERTNAAFGRKSPSPRPTLTADRRNNEEEDGPKRQPLQHSPSPFSSNTFPLRSSPKPSPKSTFSGSNTLPITDSSSTVGQLPYPYKQGNMNRSLSEGVCNGRPPVPIPGNSITQPTPPENESLSDDQWYTGKISRSEAEGALRSINEDGTFLVRDSSKSTHPFVLVVLYKNKVYNVQIRYDKQNSVYLLGSGLRGQEDFSSVNEIVEYFQRTPLLLIDGKDRGSKQQCMLTFGAGYCLNN